MKFGVRYKPYGYSLIRNNGMYRYQSVCIRYNHEDRGYAAEPCGEREHEMTKAT